MSLHDKAWHGLNILIFGSTPTLPSQIAATISSVVPAYRNRIQAFEDYEAAIDHCKKTKSIGLIILLDDSSGENLVSYFREFAKSYESRGFPCLGVLVAASPESKPTQAREKTNGQGHVVKSAPPKFLLAEKTIAGFHVKDANRNFLSYVAAQEFLDSSLTLVTLERIWHQYIEAFENELLPIQLQETLFAIIDETIDTPSIHFIDRVSLILSNQLDVSWLEAFSIRWTPLLFSVPTRFLKVIEPHQDLIALCPTENYRRLIQEPLAEVLESKTTPLWCQIAAVAYLLNEMRRQKQLTEKLANVKALLSPSGSLLFRALVTQIPTILEAALQEEKTILPKQFA